MKSFFMSSKGIVTFAICITLVGAALATFAPSLSTVGAVLAMLGIGTVIVWAFVTGKF